MARNSTPKAGKVTVTRMRQVRCETCGSPINVPPGQASADALTEHYSTKHAQP